jgi:predicted enzyme related to lactoylglutathione lyase
VHIDVLFAGMAVTDFAPAIAWYERLLGQPADIVVNDAEVMWRVADGAWLYVVADPDRAGHGLVTLAVGDLEASMAEISRRGITTGPIETVGDAGHKASVSDPDGNTISYIQVSS